MTSCFKKTGLIAVLLGSVSLLASPPAIAEELQDLQTDVAPLHDDLDEDMDPFMREDIIRLREMGVIEMQGQIGSELLMMNRLQVRADAIRNLMERLGTEGIRQFDPVLYEQISSSPIFLNQRIAELELQRRLEEAMQEPEDPPDPDHVEPGDPRGDGSDFFDPPAPRDPEPIPEPEPVPPPEPVIVDFPISLREVFGTPGDLRAIIRHGTEAIRVSPGDSLPNDTEVLTIEEDRIIIRRRDMIFEVHLRG